MILVQETFDKFGYYPKDLSYGSKSKVLMTCDYCGKVFDKINRDIKKANEIVNKDCCKFCKSIKAGDVSMIKYGFRTPMERKEVYDKIAPKCSERLKTQDFKDKRTETCIDRYGTANTMLVPEIRDKQQATLMTNFGVTNPSKSEEIQNKKIATNLEKFGSEQFFSSDTGKKAARDGCMKRFGCENPFQSEEIKEKIRRTCLAKYGFDHYLKDREVALEHAQKVLDSKVANGDVKLYDGRPLSYYAKESEYSKGRFITLVKTYGLEQALMMVPKISSLEQIMGLWLDELGLEYNKSYIENRRPDFVLEKYKLVIECDSLYYHSQEMQPDDLYHVKKMDFYASRGYDSVFFRENEIVSSGNMIKKLIKQIISQGSVLSIKVPKVIECSKEEIGSIMSNFHLIKPKLNYNSIILMNRDDIVASIQYLEDGNICYIENFCCSASYSMDGAFRELIKYIDENIPGKIYELSFDRRFGLCRYVEKYGFKLESCEPDFVWTDACVVFEKDVFKDIEIEKNFYKLYDCGQARYIKG